MPDLRTDKTESGAPPDAPAPTLAPVIVITRFSFVGNSGWKSDASRDESLLFQPDRLMRRLALFSAITLPSLAAQTDTGFQHVILTSDRLPVAAMDALEAACLAAYGGPGRHVILARPPSPARRPLRQHMEARYPGQRVVQVVLDDDDGLSVDFIARMRRALRKAPPPAPELGEGAPVFLSYPNGYGLDCSPAGGNRLYAHSYPYINLGLTMVNEASAKNILAINHLETPRLYGAQLLRQRRMFIRSVHGFNDSRVKPTGRWMEVEDWQNDTDIQSRFPYLAKAFG